MGEVGNTTRQRGQLRAIAWLRWRLFVNALRSTRVLVRDHFLATLSDHGDGLYQ